MDSKPCNGVDSEKLRICRCCLTKEYTKTVSTDYYDFEKKQEYLNMLEDVFNIQHVRETLMEQHICTICISKLLDASTFKDMVIKNQETYIKCLQSLTKEINLPNTELQINEIKLEIASESMDCNSKIEEQDVSYDENETLANLKYITQNESTTMKLKKQHKFTAEKKIKSKRCKKKNVEFEFDKPVKSIDDIKLNDHRGTGPILRENSLKLIANSTASVFQWNKSWYRCFCCKEPFSDIKLLKAHTKHHSLEDIQKKIISQQNRLVKVEISDLNCKICHDEFKELDLLKQHLLEHNVKIDEHLLVPFKIESKLKCQICLEPFSLFRHLNIHMNKHYQKHVCYICGAGFSNLVFLNLHRTRSHRPIQCQKCNLTFSSRTDKKQHDTEIHGAKFERKNRFPCQYCDERFFQENLRVKHLVDKHKMKKPEFNCQFCSKSFITRSLVNNHVKMVHMKEKKHECDVCHNLFYTKSDVARHRVTHTGEKKYACLLCSNPFASKDSLRRHMKRTHVVH